ncbi:alpha/beta hydrolase [Ornithinimicrobium sp. Arc0846-15]|nr:alpha/beta hydrolase [Ornithinimicrobium laminariae]
MTSESSHEAAHALSAKTVQTTRLQTAYREAGDAALPTVVLLHGNVSSSVFFESTMAALADRFHLIAPDFRGYGDSERATIDATRGVRDFADDTVALLDALEITGPVDFLGWSAGAGAVMQIAIDHPERVRRVILEAPMSPFGFGGSAGADGQPVTEDFAGSGGGTVNPDFCASLAAGDRSDSPTGARTTMHNFYLLPGTTLEPAVEERHVDSMLATSIGDDVYPGDSTTSPTWPYVAPGLTGMNNAISAKYCDLSAYGRLDPMPPTLWIRGDSDQIVADQSAFDLSYLGQLGAVPGWPGADEAPLQPMVTQVRHVLEIGGDFTEKVYEACAHSPHVEKPAEFVADFASFLA